MGTSNPYSAPILDLEISRELTLSRHMVSALCSSCREWSCSRSGFLRDNGFPCELVSCELVMNLLVPFAPPLVSISARHVV